MNKNALAEISAYAMQKVADNNVIIRLNYEDASMSIGAVQIFQDAILQNWSKHVDLREITIQLEIARLTNEMLKKIQQTIVNEGYNLVAAPYRFHLAAVHQPTKTMLDAFGQDIERTMTIGSGLRHVNRDKQVHAAAITLDGSWQLVPVKSVRNNGRLLTEIRNAGNRVFAIIQKK